MLTLITNPIILSIICLFTLCLLRVNVLLSIIISTIIGGLISGMHLTEIMNTFISGMGGNSETALSYILLGAFAAAMNHTGLTDIISDKIRCQNLKNQMDVRLTQLKKTLNKSLAKDLYLS